MAQDNAEAGMAIRSLRMNQISKNKRDKAKQREQYAKRRSQQQVAGLPIVAADLEMRKKTTGELIAFGFYKSSASTPQGSYKIILLRLFGTVVGYLVTLSASPTDPQPAVVAELTMKAGRCHLAKVQVDENQRRRGLGTIAVSIIADCFPGVWWTAATEAGRELSQSMVSKGLARSIGFDSPMGPLETECFEYIPRPEKLKMGESIWTDALPPARFHALLSRNRTK